MIYESDIEELEASIENFKRLEFNYKSNSSFDSQYQQWLTEAVDILEEIFGANNKFSANIINKSNAPYAFNMGGNVSKEVISDILGYLKAALKSAKRKKERQGLENDFQNSDPFVENSRIQQLKEIETEKYDLKKVLRICKELNVAKQNQSYLSIPLLTRSLIDHVPPIFDCNSFNEVTNNYGSKSFKESMKHLNKSSRKIADSFLHTQIRKRESLPNFTQVNFSSDLDVLLGEIIRILN